MKEISFIHSAYSKNQFFLKSDGTQVSYRQFSDDISSAALTIPKSCRVGLIFKSKYLFTVALFALWKNSSVAVAISRHEPLENINKLKKQSGFESILTDYDGRFSDITTTTLTLKNNIKNSNEWKLNLESEAVVIFSSGSEGPPKAVMLTLKNLYYSAIGTNEFYDIKESDIWPLTLPLNHIGGIMILIRSILAGSSVIDSDGSKTVTKLLEKFEPTTLSVVPTQLKELLDIPHAISSLQKMKRIIIGGAKTPLWLIKKCRELNIPISISYGSSEMAAQISATTPGQEISKPFLAGEILPYRGVSINSDKKIVVSGDSLFLGYLENGTVIKTGENHITNDCGFIKNGQLYVTGRADKMFICGGENISPAEIENELENIDGISKASILSLSDEKFGEVPFCFIDSDIPFANVQYELSKTVPHYKLPHFYGQFPKSTTLKLTKQLLTKHINGQFSLGMPYIQSIGDPSKETLILLHGFMGDMSEWDDLLKELNGRFHVLLIDLLGHGRSYRMAPLCNSFEQFVDMLQTTIVDWCGDRKQPTLLGYSMGGRVGLGLSCNYPKFYKKIIIESANPGIKDLKLKRERATSDLNLFNKVNSKIKFQQFLKTWYKMLLFGDLTEQQQQELVESKLHFNYSNWNKFSSNLSIGNQPPLQEKLSTIKSEAIFISGEQDKKYSKIGQELPNNFKHLIVKGVGHNTHINKLTTVISAILDS